jgi:glutamyl aminopeptidase
MQLSNERLELFKEVTQALAVPGHERTMSKILQKYYKELCDDIIFDNLGSVIGVKKSKVPNAPKVLVLGHMDEVGFLVRKIHDNGALSIHPVGGTWEQTMLSNRVSVVAHDGKVYKGVVGSIPPHLLRAEDKERPMKIENMLVDIGCSSKQEVLDLKININSPVVVDGNFEVLANGNRLLSKAFDNRYGCIMGIEILQALKDVDLPVDLYVGGSVQEEVGLRGAQTVANLVNPDFAIILDCSPANDLSGRKDELGQLGEGLLIRFADGAMIAFPQLLDWQMEMCEKNKVKYQFYSSPGGTDAGSVHKSNSGVLTLTHCICARNIHTSGSIIDIADYEGAKIVLTDMLKTLNKDLIEHFKELQR